MKKTVLILASIFFLANTAAINAELINTEGNATTLKFDEETNYTGFFQSFPANYEKPESIGSFSFRDQSLKNPEFKLRLTGQPEELANRKIQLYYASKTGEEVVKLLNNPVQVQEFNGSQTIVDVDLSSFQSLYPGKTYVGYVENEGNSLEDNLFNEETVNQENVHSVSVASKKDTNLKSMQINYSKSVAADLTTDNINQVRIREKSTTEYITDRVQDVSITGQGQIINLELSDNYRVDEEDRVTVKINGVNSATENDINKVILNPDSQEDIYGNFSSVAIDDLDNLPPYNLSKVSGGFLDGNYTVNPSIRTVAGETKLNIIEIFDSENNKIQQGRDLSQPLVMTVTRNGEVLDEETQDFGSSETFEFTFVGGEKVFVNGILSLQTKSVGRCDTVKDKDFYYIINESIFNSDAAAGKLGDTCISVSDTNNTVVDFANATIDGDGNESFIEGKCAIRVSNTSNVSLKNPRTQEFDAGICVQDSKDTFIKGTSSRENNLGIYMENSTAEITEINLKNKESEISARNDSTADLDEVDFATANISGTAEDVSLKNVFSPPPDPDELVNISQWVNISKNDNSGNIDDLGFKYKPLSETNINPKFIYKFDRFNLSETNVSESTSVVDNYKYKNLTVVKQSSNNLIFAPKEINEFSIFGVYGNRVEGNGTGNTDGRGAGDNTNGTGSQGGSENPGSGQASGGSGGGVTPEPEPEPDPDPEPININLSLNQDSISLEQGASGDIAFEIRNNGDVSASNVYVEADVRSGWQSGRQDYDSIGEGEEVDGDILLEVFESEVTGNYSIPVNVNTQSGVKLDTERLRVEVLPRQDIRDLKIVESPTFLTLESGNTEELGFLLDNIGDYNLKNVTAEVRNADQCIQNVQGSHSFNISERKNVEYKVKTGNKEAQCTGVFVFNSQNTDEVAFTPIRIQVQNQPLVEQLTSNILPILLIVWTIFTGYWIRRRYY